MLKMIRVQEITLEHTRKGITQEWVFQNIIKEKFFINRSAYYKYLGTNAKKLIKEQYPEALNET